MSVKYINDLANSRKSYQCIISPMHSVEKSGRHTSNTIEEQQLEHPVFHVLHQHLQQWRIREFLWQEIAPENSESGNQIPPAVAVGQNQVENDGSTASGSDPENLPAARRGPVQPSGPPLNWTPAPWKRFRREG